MDIVITHHNADLDALASLIAASKVYDAIPVQGRMVNPLVRRYLAIHKDHFNLKPYTQIDPTQVESVTIVDVRDGRRLKEYALMLEHAKHIRIWDHHPPGEADLEGDEVVVDPTGACVTLLVEQLILGGRGVSEAEATVMMLGLYADTGRLSYRSTTVRDIDAASWLLRQGANLSVVHRYLREEFNEEQQELLMQLLRSTHEVSHDAVEVAIATATMPRPVQGSAHVVHRVMQMGGHDAILGIIASTKGSRVQLIGRSRVPYVDVGEMSRRFGGGGHPAAAAAQFKKRELDDVVNEVEGVLRQSLWHPTRVSDLMTSPVQTVAHDLTLEACEEVFEKAKISGAPVFREGRLCGMISRRDLEGARLKLENLSLPVSAKMTHHVEVIAPDEPLEDALAHMTKHDIGRLPVCLESGRLVGILSRTDVLRHLYKE